MLDDGLLERFPFEEILASTTCLGSKSAVSRRASARSCRPRTISKSNSRGSAATPPDTLVAACALVTNLQTIAARRLSPTDIGVVSVTELLTDGTRNALPGLSRILGDARSFRPEVSAAIEKQMRIIAEGTALAYNLAVDAADTREFAPLINDTILSHYRLWRAKDIDRP